MPAGSTEAAGSAADAAVDAGAAAADAGAQYAFVFPNLMLNAYGPWVDTNVVAPLTEDSCSVRFDWYLRQDRAGDASYVEQSLASSHEVGRRMV